MSVLSDLNNEFEKRLWGEEENPREIIDKVLKMPFYDYVCQDCKNKFEIEHKICQPPVECRRCGGKLRRIFSPPNVVQTGYKQGEARYRRGMGK